MSRQLKCNIKRIDELASDIFRLTIESDDIAASAKPGQFVNIKCDEGTQALLRRPISICSIDRKNGCCDLLFQKKGNGTRLLSMKKVGDELDVLAPLGNGFDLEPKYSRIAVVGGGIGIFPLLFLLQESQATVKKAYLGFRTKELIVLEKEFSRESSLAVATDDGSYGTHGFVTDLLKKDLAAEHFDMIYACGPTPMLRKVAETAQESGTACQVSLEQRMGCGFGACLVCACKTRAEDGSWQYGHVCKDGPVFSSRDVYFD